MDSIDNFSTLLIVTLFSVLSTDTSLSIDISNLLWCFSNIWLSADTNSSINLANLKPASANCLLTTFYPSLIYSSVFLYNFLSSYEYFLAKLYPSYYHFLIESSSNYSLKTFLGNSFNKSSTYPFNLFQWFSLNGTLRLYEYIPRVLSHQECKLPLYYLRDRLTALPPASAFKLPSYILLILCNG